MQYDIKLCWPAFEAIIEHKLDQLTFYKRGMLQYSKAVTRPGWHLCFTNMLSISQQQKHQITKLQNVDFQIK